MLETFSYRSQSPVPAIVSQSLSSFCKIEQGRRLSKPPPITLMPPLPREYLSLSVAEALELDGGGRASDGFLP